MSALQLRAVPLGPVCSTKILNGSRAIMELTVEVEAVLRFTVKFVRNVKRLRALLGARGWARARVGAWRDNGSVGKLLERLEPPLKVDLQKSIPAQIRQLILHY